MAFEVPPLPYDYAALEPHIDEQTMRVHHDKHHQAYVDKANAALEGTEWADKDVNEVLQNLSSLGDKETAVRNNAGGHANHTLHKVLRGMDGITKNNNVSPSNLLVRHEEAPEAASAVTQFVHQKIVTDQQRIFHRAGRNLERLQAEGDDEQSDGQHQRHRLDEFRLGLALFLLRRRFFDSVGCFCVLCHVPPTSFSFMPRLCRFGGCEFSFQRTTRKARSQRVSCIKCVIMYARRMSLPSSARGPADGSGLRNDQ